MAGRMREICQGVNVDLGAAAEFRDQMIRNRHFNRFGSESQQHILLKANQSPGDAVVMTAAIWSLHQSDPFRYRIGVESNYPQVFEFNPHVTHNALLRNPKEVEMHYPAIHDSNERGIHFMQAYCEFLGEALGAKVPLLTNRPRLYFQGKQPEVEDFWVVCSGGKNDFTNKLWRHENYQRVIDILQLRRGFNFIQIGENHSEHKKLVGADYQVGDTSLREVFDLVRRSKGVLCGVSLLMHIAAALEKPAIVIAGGREPVAWNCYPKQHYLHTVGVLPCTTPQGKQGACWRSRTVPLGDNKFLDEDTCQFPVGNTPKCMTLITPEEVVTKILLCEKVYEFYPSNS